MLARYLGSKRTIIGPLMDAVREVADPGEHVVDAFSGSLTVSMAMKRAGYRVTANDINLFSSVFAQAYLLPTSCPAPDLQTMLTSSRIRDLTGPAKAKLEALRGKNGFTSLDSPDTAGAFLPYLILLEHLSGLDPLTIPEPFARTDFFDTYCEAGLNSAFTSQRGTAGRRRFFTPENAIRIDAILSQLRWWNQVGAIDAQTLATVLSALVRAVERVSNTQGTFHDFIRTGWDSRARTPLRLDPIALDNVVAGPSGHAAGHEQDTLQFIGDVEDHALLYLDPPYNFRQYTAYYFLPNVICRYPALEDPEQYFHDVTYVRGQNPRDDFTSSFCKASTFISDMRQVIRQARARTIMISYFNGATHWGKFDSDGDDTGRKRLEALLSEPDLIRPDTLRVVEVPRRNYASYGGYTARPVTELLLVADKARHDDVHASERRTQRGFHSVA